MTLARTLASAVLAASLLAADLVLLTLFLNPEASLRRDGIALLLSLFLPYALLGTAAFALLPLLAALLRGRPAFRAPLVARRLPWLGPLAFLALAAATALFCASLFAYRHSIPVEFVRALALCCVALGGSTLVLVAVGVDVLVFPDRTRGASAALVVLACASALVVPLALRPLPGRAPRPLPLAVETTRPLRRVVLIGIDGLGPEQLRAGIARGALPELARLLRRGAHGPLATLRPTQGPPVWASVFSGRLPRDHGVMGFSSYRLRGSQTRFELLPAGAFVGLLERAGFVSRTPVIAGARKCRTLWEALNAFGIETGVVRFWGTYPAERVKGFMLANYFHLLQDDPARAADTLHPPDLLPEVRARAVHPADVDPALLAEFVDAQVPLPDDLVPWRRDLVERALAPDLSYRRAGSVLRAAYDPPFFATYFYGLDVVGHSFLRFAEPDRFGDVRPEQARRYGHVVDRYASLLEQFVGEAARELRPNEVLLVVSGYGMEPLPLWRRLLASLSGDAAAGGTHAAAPDGIILAVGDGVKAGAAAQAASVLDVAPTILYLMGLPVARDMQGRVLTEILDDALTRAHAITYIPSYESLAVTPTAARGAPELPPLPGEEP